MNYKKIYLKYLFSGVFSSIIMTIYTLVDSLCIGQYEGSLGSAAIACGIPVWTLIYSTGLLFGVGGATLMMIERGKNDYKRSNQIFTQSLILATITCILLWILMIIFQKPLLIFFGAKDSNVLKLITIYTNYLKWGLPFFFFSQFLTVMVRNDSDPIRATVAVIGGGVVNAILDPIFVFGCDMGINGAGLATFSGMVFTVIILLSHFISKKNTLKLVRSKKIKSDSKLILVTGLSSFLLDICMGIITIVFNNQITKYGGEYNTIYLAIYGIIINMVTLTQSLGYAVGQASQPLLSENVGKKDKKAISSYFKYGVISSIVIAVIVFSILEILSPVLLKAFIKAESGTIEMTLGLKVLRIYFISFLFIIFNVYSIYYFNSILKKNTSLFIAIMRGLILPLLTLIILPIIKFDLIWYSMIICEGLLVIINIILMIHTKLDKIIPNEG